MKKLFVKYLFLSIILLSGYAHLIGANTHVGNNDNLFKTVNTSCVAHGKNDTYIAKSTLSHFEKLNCEIEITDSEDDEVTSLKKSFKASPYFAKSTATPQSDYIIDHIQQASFIKKFSHLISCKRYILLRVIRI
ncbi:hypothetical protein [Wenyingzhuangia sp. IMCC45467]